MQQGSDSTHATAFVPVPQPAVTAVLLGRRKRFLADCLVSGKHVTAHSNNTGSMLGLTRPGSHILLSPAISPSRKLPWTLEAIFCGVEKNGFWVGVNTLTPNRMLAAAFKARLLPCTGYTHLKTEIKRGLSRLDGLLEGENMPRLWVECKNVTLVEDDVALFPDAMSERGCRHLMELMDIVRSGERAAMFYLVQRADGHCFAPADCVDPVYARLFWQAVNAGVEIWPFRADVSQAGVTLAKRLPLIARP